MDRNPIPQPTLHFEPPPWPHTLPPEWQRIVDDAARAFREELKSNVLPSVGEKL